MKIQLFLTAFTVNFSYLVYGLTVQENAQNLFDSIATNRKGDAEIYRQNLKHETAREQQVFDKMKEKLRKARERQAHRQRNSYTRNHVGENVVVVKRKTKHNNQDNNRLEEVKLTNASVMGSASISNGTRSNYRLKPADYLRIRTGVLDPVVDNDDGRSEEVILTVNTRDIHIFNITEEDIRYLDNVTDVAYFGRDFEKVTDVSYRNSKYTKLFNLNLNFHDLQMKLGIGEMLLKPYKLNLYTKGSFFNAHRDTHRPGLTGTLILILPTMYEGGEICFGDFCPEATITEKNKLRFVYFDIGLEHSISEVKSGHRISLVYNVVDPSSHKSIESNASFSEIPEEVYQGLLHEAVEFCKNKTNILFGRDKHRNDVFYKLLNDLKKQFKIVPVAVKSGCCGHNISMVDEVYALRKEDPKGFSHYCDPSRKLGELKHFSHGIYKVKHRLFPLVSVLKEHSINMHGPGRHTGNEPENMYYNIECYTGFLINPFYKRKGREFASSELDFQEKEPFPRVRRYRY